MDDKITSTSRQVLAAFVVLLLALCQACKAPESGTFSDIFETGVSLQGLDGLSLDDQDDVPSWDYPDVPLGDGRITRVIWLSAGESAPLHNILRTTPVVTEKKVVVAVVTKFPAQHLYSEVGEIKPLKHITMDALSLTGFPEDVDLATDIIVGVQKSIPQIEVGIRVVEVLESDSFAFGADSAFSSVESDPDSPTKSFFNRAATALGLPEIPGRGGSFNLDSFDVPLLLDLGTITNGVQVDFLIRALKLFTKTDLLSAPHIRVLDGYSARIEAGEEIPFFQPNFNASGFSTITTQFKSVGIKLYITPKVVGRDLVRINLTTAVEAVTGESTFQSADVNITNPVITTRRASTYMDVYDSDTAIIGGLLRRSKFNNENVVPILGELPILDLFFSSRSEQVIQSNLIFFITPRIIDVSRERRRMITPVAPSKDEIAPKEDEKK